MSIKIIAECGCNHCGDFELAKKMIYIAKYYCGADIIKFQKRTPKELLTSSEYNNKHPIPECSYGRTYGEHREILEFDVGRHKELKALCDSIGIKYSCSVWDFTSAKEIISLNPEMIKIPSACNNNYDLLDYIYFNYNGEIHIALGMITIDETTELLNYLRSHNFMKRTVLYHCVSGYPLEYKDTYLLEIKELVDLLKDEIKGIGFSGHHKGIFPDIMSITLGTQYIERHFTLDHSFKGTDHKASLEPDELKLLVSESQKLLDCLNKKPDKMCEVEEIQRRKLKWNRQLHLSQ